MKDWIHSALKWMSYNRWTVIAFVMGVSLFAGVSCSSTAPSPITGKPVTASQLGVEKEQWVEAAKLRAEKLETDYKTGMSALESEARSLDVAFDASFAEIEKQDGLKLAILEMVGKFTATMPGASEALGIASLLFTGGVIVDNRRKDKRLKDFKNGTTPVTA